MHASILKFNGWSCNFPILEKIQTTFNKGGITFRGPCEALRILKVYLVLHRPSAVEAIPCSLGALLLGLHGTLQTWHLYQFNVALSWRKS